MEKNFIHSGDRLLQYAGCGQYTWNLQLVYRSEPTSQLFFCWDE
mgnify:CR=1 FL=1